MMRRVLLGAAAAATIWTVAVPAHAVVTIASTDADDLASTLAGSGINIISASLTSDTENGFFNGGAAALGIGEGVALTSGRLGCIGSINTSGNCSGIGTTTVFELVFTPGGDSLLLNYVFGSEAYNDQLGASFLHLQLDIFQIELTGPGFSSANLERLPNGTIVSIRSVNLLANPEFYLNNSDEPARDSSLHGNLNLPIELDGLTTVLSAQANGLTPGAEYVLRFEVSDRPFESFRDSGDSVLFIEAGSITSPAVAAIPEPTTWIMLIAGFGMAGAALRRRRPEDVRSFRTLIDSAP